jgi:hypothetical protein
VSVPDAKALPAAEAASRTASPIFLFIGIKLLRIEFRFVELATWHSIERPPVTSLQLQDKRKQFSDGCGKSGKFYHRLAKWCFHASFWEMRRGGAKGVTKS